MNGLYPIVRRARRPLFVVDGAPPVAPAVAVPPIAPELERIGSGSSNPARKANNEKPRNIAKRAAG